MDCKLRFAVKDIVDVAGLETGLGNRSYRKLYPGRPSSARCIKPLLDAGAILVGKTKTTQFAEGQVPIQWYGSYPHFLTKSFHPHIHVLHEKEEIRNNDHHFNDGQSSGALIGATLSSPLKNLQILIGKAT